MKDFSDLSYVSASGLRVAVNHATDDPFVGKPMSAAAVHLRNEGPIAVEWTYKGKHIRREFKTDIQAALDPCTNLLIVVGHGCADLDGAPTPNNGVIISAEGTDVHRLICPARILSARGPQGEPILPDGFAALEVAVDRLEVWISYWEGEWLERRAYDGLGGHWGAVSAHMRAR